MSNNNEKSIWKHRQSRDTVPLNRRRMKSGHSSDDEETVATVHTVHVLLRRNGKGVGVEMGVNGLILVEKRCFNDVLLTQGTTASVLCALRPLPSRGLSTWQSLTSGSTQQRSRSDKLITCYWSFKITKKAMHISKLLSRCHKLP